MGTLGQVDVRALSGTSFRDYQLGAPLGAGDSAIVYSAKRNRETFAIKIFFPDALDKHGYSEEAERLALQLQLAGKKQHPNLVQIYEGGAAPELGDTLFLVMESVPGFSIDKLVGKMPRHAIAPLIRQLADAAKFLEDAQLAHRDIKPANIVVSEDFTRLTLLDLGIVKNVLADENGRLSGYRFVSTPRYSPPEFVWRNEVESLEAWRAITFYQIGGTLHDMIEGKCLFAGVDQPAARLYDSIKGHSPEFSAQDCPQWLILLAKRCLIKDWRERLRLLSWESFSEPTMDEGLELKQTSIRTRQVRMEEARLARAVAAEKIHKSNEGQDLWELQDRVFMDLRRFVISTQVFPKCTVTHLPVQHGRYTLKLDFEAAPEQGFDNPLSLSISLANSSVLKGVTELAIKATCSENAILEGSWSEVLTIETASKLIQTAMMDVADRVVPNN